jgi:hypothetical protein
LFNKYFSPRDAAYARALSDPRLGYDQAILDPTTKSLINPARRGNPDNNDAYMTFSLKVGIAIGRQAGINLKFIINV